MQWEKVGYHPTKGSQVFTVDSKDNGALPEGWVDNPGKLPPKPEPEVKAEAKPADHGADIADLRTRIEILEAAAKKAPAPAPTPAPKPHGGGGK